MVAASVVKVCGIIEQVNTSLRLHPNPADYAWHVNRLSLAHRLDFLTQMVPPNTPGVAPLLREADERRMAALAITVGFDPCKLLPTEPDPSFTRDRAHLSVRFNGLGVIRNADTARAAFVGAIELVLPRFPDTTNEAGDITPGLFPHLEVVTGNFAGPAGRYATFIGSGLQLGRDFEAAWESMRAECTPQPGTIFSVPAAEAPGVPHFQDARPEEGGRVRLQRLCTAQIQRVRSEELRRRATELPLEDMRAIALHYHSPAAAFSTLPQASTALSATEFPSAMAVYMGLVDPRVVEVLASMGDRQVFFQDSSSQRILDPHGNNLSLFMGSGHGRTKFHNEIQAELYFLSQSVGMGMRQTPTDLFTPCILPRNRQRYDATVREHLRRHTGNCNGGLVPDLYNPRSGQMYDVKTTGHKDDYSLRRSVVDLKAATVPNQYRTRARAADATFNETTPETAPGPVEARLTSMKQVLCISVGAFGEVNRATSNLLGEIAEAGSSRPERFGCCHGQEQAKGVIAQWAMRRFGRICLRGVIRARHCALAVVTAAGGGRAPSHRATGLGEATWNEWDSESSNRAWVPHQ